MKFTHLSFAGKIAGPLGVALADFDHVVREFTCFGITLGEIFLEVAPVPTNRIAELGKALEELEDFLELTGTEDFAIGQIFDLHFIGADTDEDFVELRVVIDILLALLPLDEVERRLCDVDLALLDEFHHVTAEKSEQQCANVGAVHIGIGHDDDASVAELFDVETAFAILLCGGDANASADGCDEGLDFGILKDLVEAGFLDIDDFALDRQDRLESPVAALFRGAAGRVALDHIEFGEVWVALGAICQLSGESAACERTLANRLTSLAGRFAGTGGHEALLDDALANIWILVEVQHEALVADRADNALHLWRNELHLGLGLKTRIGMFHAHDSGEAFEHIVAGDGDILFLQQGIVLGILVDRTGQGTAESTAVRAPIGIWDGVCVAEKLLVVGVRVVQSNFHDHFVPRAFDHDRLGMDESFVLNKAVHKLLHSARVDDLQGSSSLLAFVDESEGQRRVDIREIIQAGNDTLGFEFDCFLENLRIRHESNQRARLLRGLDFSDHMELLLGRSPFKRHRVDFSFARDFHFEPFGNSIDALRSHAVSAAGVFVVALAVFAAGVQACEHELHTWDALLFVDIHRNPTPVVTDGNRTVCVDGHIDVSAVAGQKFIDRVVKHLAHAMVERSLVGAANIHARLLANGFETLEGTQIIGGVAAGFEVWTDFGGFIGFGCVGAFFGNVFFWHLIQIFVGQVGDLYREVPTSSQHREAMFFLISSGFYHTIM